MYISSLNCLMGNEAEMKDLRVRDRKRRGDSSHMAVLCRHG